MDWQQALRQRAKDHAGLTALAGGQVEWRERVGFPALVLTGIADPRPLNLKSEPTNRRSRVQVDCWAKDRATATALSSAAIAALTPAGTFNGVHFGRAIVLDPGVRDLGEPTESGFVHRDSLDLEVWHD